MASSTPDASSDEREDVEQSIGEEEEQEEESKYQNSEQDEEDESEEEEEVVQRKPVVLKHTPASESKQDSDSDLAETQSSPTASAFTIQPSTKPKEKSPKPKTPTSKSTSAKRPLEETKPDDATGSAMGSKKKKSKISNGDEEEKKTAIIRLFSDDDETAILKGMDDYQRKKGLNPNANMASFLEFVKSSIKVVVSKSQLSEKIRRLKKKYQNNVAKGEDGKDPVFSKPHEHNLFRLSKKFWGGGVVGLTGNGMEDSKVTSSKKKDNGNGVDDSKFTSSKKKDNGQVVSDSVAKVINDSAVAEEVVTVDENKEEERKDFWSMYPRLSKSLELDSSIYLLLPKDAENFVKERMSLIGREKASQLEEKWKDILVMEYELYAKRLELIHEQVQLVVDEMKPSKS